MTAPRDPEEVTAKGAPAVAAVPEATRMGAVHLSVADLARSTAYYESAIGLRVHDRVDGRVALGAGGEDLLVLRRGAGRAPARRVRRPLPLRPARARARRPRPLARPRRPRAGAARRALRPLRQRGDLPLRPRRARDRDLLGPPARGVGGPGLRAHDDAAARRRRPARRARRPAHGALRRPRRRGRWWATSTCGRRVPGRPAFYRDALGFGADGRARRAGGVLAAGGYHHHVGANTWDSRGARARAARSPRRSSR